MSDVEIDLEVTCAVPSDRLWDVLLKPELWWGEDILLEARPGGQFHEPWHDKEGQHHTLGRVMEVSRGSLLRLSWADDDWTFRTEVQFLIDAAGNGSTLALCHRGWQDAPPDHRATLLDNHRKGWAYHLGNLLSAAEKAN